MRILKYKDKEAYISECDYKMLLERFNISKAKEDESGDMEIDAPCLCEKYPVDCKSLKNKKPCPFEAFGQNIPCIDWLEQYIPVTNLSFGDDCLWFAKDSKQLIKKVYNILKRLKKVDRRKK